MRHYQLEGLNWLISLYENNVNGILADEMGLGKTLQTLAFIGYLKMICNTDEPILIVAPKSTIINWLQESNKWIPDLKTLVLHGDKSERANIIKSIKSDTSKDGVAPFDVLITSYEIGMIERSFIKKIKWVYLVIDEAHRIKNEQSLLSQIVRLIPTNYRLLITGTPLQNNLHELWALLNFLMPELFSSSEEFDEWFLQLSSSKTAKQDNSSSDNIIDQLRMLLKPCLLRRLKLDVEKGLPPKKEICLFVPPSPMQKLWYQKILEKDIESLILPKHPGLGKLPATTRLMNIVMQLRKCCNHPYLFDGAEPGPPYAAGFHLIENSGKMIALHKLLVRCKENGSRVLIFSQMSRMLDIIEDFCDAHFLLLDYCRIDGQTDSDVRVRYVEEYNAPNSSKFIFLLTTRAGGLGINLYTADVVVIYDSDWNPQADLQAQDRAHRIGQKKPVKVFRLLTENSIEERILDKSLRKLRLDQLVIQRGHHVVDSQPSSVELINMIKSGASDLLDDDSLHSMLGLWRDVSIESLIEQGETKTREIFQRYQSIGIEDLHTFSVESGSSAPDLKNGDDPLRLESSLTRPGVDLSGKRGRRSMFSTEDPEYREALGLPVVKQPITKPQRQAKGLRMYQLASANSSNRSPFQLHPLRLFSLLEKESNWNRRNSDFVIPIHLSESESSRIDREKKQDLIRAGMSLCVTSLAQPLSESEINERDLLFGQGFIDWSRKEFIAFSKASEKHGRHAYEKISTDIGTKDVAEVKRYSEAFWSMYPAYPAHNIERGEEKLQKSRELYNQICCYVKYSKNLPDSGFPKSKFWTPSDDNYLVGVFH
ncbi:hypothetical protein DI09_39p120 [Mitosporidium daphniae]|uniref:Uncharacterized protein n=1 Tax=Mitosporidium daphniae TaxID=1485682 RepID=A0A098VQM3_9MICR|nr:uncharacterized protein DI09_39p120 [Mitosporidium daphniae]KGG51318.1 hypothetical protein DI09_39p120 [Mitosporidium daphniae]|eukprot:XP_013237745.1 uncharacterized protein DI09_39p120 [Mitosporidium daphniae]